MPVFTVVVKWGKEKFENVELNSDESPELFKAQLFALSGVAPERQKVMYKGSVLKVCRSSTDAALSATIGMIQEFHNANPTVNTRVVVKWGKEKFENVELNSDESPELFKAQLFALSGVAPERQKVMYKGSVLKLCKLLITFFPILSDVKYMHTGLKSRLVENIEKKSATLGRDAVYTKTSKLSRLPAYLTVQFVRFYFKEKDAINAKILKDVKFPLSLDVFDLCTEKLQQKLMPIRAKFKEIEDKKVEEAAKRKKEGGKEPMDVDKKTRLEPFSFPDDVGSNNSGYYELTAVLTHQGRSSSSGHYLAWIRRKGGVNDWVKCDDDKMSNVTSEDILKLSGGGDWHCAYVLLYGPRRLEVEDDN
ncbi:PREDICTED: ubiquitin carboxyl-terminal hydrolase 14-like [Acropora digitifera]|uniref:ubiquitin carboxyl-terminal hydrolase 14-like n=1 Tax=Acropora digitifera TaxID=70779 RepID=UPI00077B103A|nr:PREDICTED: ubiquitin carboxyl-terminal hydrolase 14-like [Acropora digitifera]